MLSVLVVDSDPGLRRFVAFLLTSAGHTVREAAGIRAAAALLREAPADLLLTDLTQPTRHAAETFEAIRDAFRSVEVITFAGLSYAARCLRLCTALDCASIGGRRFTNRETRAFVAEMVAGIAAHSAHVPSAVPTRRIHT